MAHPAVERPGPVQGTLGLPGERRLDEPAFPVRELDPVADTPGVPVPEHAEHLTHLPQVGLDLGDLGG